MGKKNPTEPEAEAVYEKPTCKLKIDLPKMKTLFDECAWGPFVSNEEPGRGSWDAEDRASIASEAKGALRKHACGDKGRLSYGNAFNQNQTIKPSFEGVRRDRHRRA